MNTPMNRPTPDPSQEGSKRSSASCQFPSWERLGVGGFMLPRHAKNETGLSMNLVAVPAASCGGVSPPARIPGGTPDALAREDACATSAGQFMGRLLANNERSHSTRLLKPGAL